jgi:RimJ/RimL family protein N-acetyltransferase
MKTRWQPRVFSKYIIKDKDQEIGKIFLVDYICGKSTPHIEFFLNEGYKNKGIMSREFPKFLKKMKKWEFNQALAIVKQDNIASIKILEKNGFIKIKPIEDKICYLIDLRITPAITEKIFLAMKANYRERNIARKTYITQLTMNYLSNIVI